MSQSTTTVALENLNDTSLLLADAQADIRGRNVIDRDGNEIGHVSDLFIDVEHRKVRMIETQIGGFLG